MQTRPGCEIDESVGGRTYLYPPTFYFYPLLTKKNMSLQCFKITKIVSCNFCGVKIQIFIFFLKINVYFSTILNLFSQQKWTVVIISLVGGT